MSKTSVRHVKFTPQELAYDPTPQETSDWMPVPGRGWTAYKRFLEWKRRMVRLDPDVRQAFPDDRSVNAALRKVLEIQEMKAARSRKRSA